MLHYLHKAIIVSSINYYTPCNRADLWGVGSMGKKLMLEKHIRDVIEQILIEI